MSKRTWREGRWLALAFMFCCATGMGQEHTHPPEIGAGIFPGALFENLSEFSVAIHAHGDLRGNIGPCG